MATYTVTLTRTVKQSTTVLVVADTDQEARELALEEDYEWGGEDELAFDIDEVREED